MAGPEAGEKMNSTKMPCNAPANFNHPYTPYDVQLEFMRTVYDVLENGNGQIGILESPTGTVSDLMSVSDFSIHATRISNLRNHN